MVLMLTERETQLLSYATALRLDERAKPLWLVPRDDALPDSLPDAITLCEHGYLDREVRDDHLAFRASD
jgi:hypothetical protein